MKKLTVYTNRIENIAGYVYICIQMFILPCVLAIINSSIPRQLSSGELNFIYFCVNIVCVAVIFHRYLFSSIKLLLHNPFIILRYAILGFFAYHIGRFIIAYIVLRLYPEFSNLNDQAVMDSVAQNYTLMSIGVVLLAPITEEVLYRGVIFGGIYKIKPILAYVISSVVFSLIHIIGYIGLYNPVDLLCSFLIYLPAGLFLAWAYEKSGCIVAPILIHIATNQLGILYLR